VTVDDDIKVAVLGIFYQKYKVSEKALAKAQELYNEALALCSDLYPRCAEIKPAHAGRR
jgi:hypothetical protein